MIAWRGELIACLVNSRNNSSSLLATSSVALSPPTHSHPELASSAQSYECRHFALEMGKKKVLVWYVAEFAAYELLLTLAAMASTLTLLLDG